MTSSWIAFTASLILETVDRNRGVKFVRLNRTVLAETGSGGWTSGSRNAENAPEPPLQESTTGEVRQWFLVQILA